MDGGKYIATGKRLLRREHGESEEYFQKVASHINKDDATF